MKPQSFLETGRITADQVKTSQKWLDGKITEFNKLNLTPRKVLNDTRIQMVTIVMPGKMYMYSYDPKFKETLPYYDKFPLVLPFARTQDSFTGLNLHYLSYDMRIRLFKELLKISGTTHFDETTKIKYSWV